MSAQLDRIQQIETAATSSAEERDTFLNFFLGYIADELDPALIEKAGAAASAHVARMRARVAA